MYPRRRFGTRGLSWVIGIWISLSVWVASSVMTDDLFLFGELSSPLTTAARYSQNLLPNQLEEWQRNMIDLITQDNAHALYAISLFREYVRTANGNLTLESPFQEISLSSAEFRVDATCTSVSKSCTVTKKIRVASQWCEAITPGLFASTFSTGTIENVSGFMINNLETCEDCPMCFAVLTSGSSPEPQVTARMHDQNSWTIRVMINPTFPLPKDRVKKLEPFIDRVLTQASRGLVTQFSMEIVQLSVDSRCTRVNCFLPGASTKTYLTTLLLAQQEDPLKQYDSLSVSLGGSKGVIRLRRRSTNALEANALRTTILAAILMCKGLMPHDSTSLSINDGFDYSSGAIGLTFSAATTLSALPRLRLGWMESQNVQTIDLWGDGQEGTPSSTFTLYDSASSLTLPTAVVIKFRTEGFLLVEYEAELKTIFIRRLLASSQANTEESLFSLAASMPQVLVATLKPSTLFRFGSFALQLVHVKDGGKANLRIITCPVPSVCVSGICLDDGQLTNNGTGWCFTDAKMTTRTDCEAFCPIEPLPQLNVVKKKQRKRISTSDYDGDEEEDENETFAQKQAAPIGDIVGAVATGVLVSVVVGVAMTIVKRRRSSIGTNRKQHSDSSLSSSPELDEESAYPPRTPPRSPTSQHNRQAMPITPSRTSSTLRRASGGFMEAFQAAGRRLTGDFGRRVSQEQTEGTDGLSLLNETEDVQKKDQHEDSYLDTAGRKNPYTPRTSQLSASGSSLSRRRSSLSSMVDSIFSTSSSRTGPIAAPTAPLSSSASKAMDYARRSTSLATDVSHQRGRGLRRYSSAQVESTGMVEEPFVTGGRLAQRLATVDSSDEEVERDDDDDDIGEQVKVVEIETEGGVRMDMQSSKPPKRSSSQSAFERRRLARRQTAGL